jgi:molybdopterin synthase sulfur carrier subunit
MREIRLLYFASVRELIGIAEETRILPEDVDTPAALAKWLSASGPGYAAALAEIGKLRFAADQEVVAHDAPIGGAYEIAIFPPVTGG